MKMTGHILLMCGLVTLVSMATDAISCYECSTPTSDPTTCTNPFNVTFTKTCSGVSCYVAITNREPKVIERGCRNDSQTQPKSTKVDKRQATECHCNTDHCNNFDYCPPSASLGLRAGVLLCILSLIMIDLSL